MTIGLEWLRAGAAGSHIDLYHHTTPEIAKQVYEQKKMISKENTGSIFFTTHPDSGYSAAFGEGAVHVRMPQAHLDRLADQGKAWQDDEFPSGEQHWAIHHSGLRPEHFVRDGQSHTAAGNHEYSAGRMRVSDIRRPGEGRLSEREYTQRELTADVRRNGVQQPLAIEDFPVHGGPTTFNGLHRLDAAERAGVHDVPVVVRHRKGIPPPMTEHRPSTEDEFNAAFDLEREGRWRGGKTAAGVDDYGMRARPFDDGDQLHDLGDHTFPEDVYDHPEYYPGHSNYGNEHIRQMRAARGKPDHPVTIYRASPPGAPRKMHTGDWVALSHRYAAFHGDMRHAESGDRPGEEWHVHKAVVPARHVRTATGSDLHEWGYWGPPVDSEDAGAAHHHGTRINTPPSGMDWEENLRFLRHRKRSEPLMHRGLAVELPPEVHNLVHDQFQDRDRQARAIAEHLRGRPLGMHWSAGEQTPRHFADWERKNNSPGSTKVILHAALPEVEHIETDPEKLNEGGVFRYGGPGGSEHEIPMKAGAPVRIKGVTWYGYGNRKRSGDLYDHVHTASLTPRDELPPDPGTKPIPEGHVRLWHYTPLENADSIREHGLLRDKARSDVGNGDLSEPSAGVWASTKRPDDVLDNHSGHAAVVEYHAHPDEISGNAESPWQAMKKDRTWDDEKVQSWANSGGHHVIMRGDVPPSHILDVHEPWHGSARYMRDDKNGHSSYGWVRDEYAKGNSPELEPYVKGLDALEKGHRHEAATNWDEFHDKIPGEIHRGLYAPQSHGVFSALMSDEDIAHGLIAAHQEEHFPYERDQRKLFGTHWTSDEGVARNFAQEHEREHHEDPQCSDHDEHSEATQVVFHAERPARHEIEHDPRRLGWQNVDDYTDPEHEVPIKHGAPVRIKGVSWLKHTGLGPMWHRHDLREPVELRAEDRDSPDDPNQWNASLHHEAAGKGLPYMPEPSDSQLEEHLYRRHGLDPELTPYGNGKHWHRWHAAEHQHRTTQDHQHEHLTGAPLEESYSTAFQPDEETDSDTWGYSGGHSTPPGHQDIPQTSPLLTGDPNRHLSSSFVHHYETYGPDGTYVQKQQTVEGPFYHGGRARLGPGGLLTPGRRTNSWGDEGPKSTHIHFTTDREGAAGYARLSNGHLYEVEPTGEVHQGYDGSEYKSKHPLRVVRKVPREEWDSQHTAAAGHLQNPHTGGSEWFHGTQAHKEDLEKGFSDPVSSSTGLYQTPESENDDSGHWNSLLGTHFTADHAIANEFAKGEHSGSDNEGYGDDQEEHQGVVHAKLNIKNPKHYASEHDMDHEAYEHEHAAGNHPINHLSDYEDDEEYGEETRNEMWPHAMQIHHDYGKSEIPASTYGHYMSPFEKHPMRTAWLNTHPDKVGIAQRFKKRLQDQGHDGVTYGNEYEKSRWGRAGNTSAIAFHPDQAEITEHHHVEEPCQREPLSHLAAAWTPSQRIFGPTYGLDHRLFEGDQLRPEVRQVIMERLGGVLPEVLSSGWQELTCVYLAGSEASEWTGPDLEGNGDFDTLIGVQFDAARRQVPGLAALTDMEIADKLNHLLRAQYNEAHWHPAFLSEDDRWGKEWDLTGYVNVNGWDIRDLKPYAAYDITDDRWAVKPPHLPGNSSASFPAAVLAEARAVASQVRAILKLPEPDRTREGISLWNKIHADRSAAFGLAGHGWDDPGNVIEKFLDQHPHHLLDKLRGLKFKTAAFQPGDLERPTADQFIHEVPEHESWLDQFRVHRGKYLLHDSRPGMITAYRIGQHGLQHPDAQTGHPKPRRAGYLTWFGGGIRRKDDGTPDDSSNINGGVIYKTQVSGPHRRKGVASAMLAFARELHPELEIRHSRALSPDGKEWASKVAGGSGDRYVTCDQGHSHWGAHGAAGLLVRHKGEDGTHRYLLQKRGDDVDHGGTWSTPGGALHAGESPQEGALRESGEELGTLPGDLAHHHTVTDDHGGWAYHTVVMDSPRQFTPEGGGSTDYEHAGHGWFSPDEVKDLNLHPGFARTWDTVRQSRTDKTAAARKKYLRIGDWHHSETSRNYATGDTEPGVSVYDLHEGIHPVIPDGENAFSDLRARLQSEDPKHLVIGDEVGRGGDNEPLLKNVRRTGRYPMPRYSNGWEQQHAGSGKWILRNKDAGTGKMAAAKGHMMPVEQIRPMSSEYGEGVTMGDIAKYSPARMASDRYEPEDLEGLVEDVRRHGVREPIELDGDGVGDGHHRYWAAEQAGLTHVPVVRKTAVWDTSGSDKTGVYVRFGHWPDNERSYSPAGGYNEDGVSAYDIDKHGNPAIDHGLDRGHVHDEHCDPDCDMDTEGPDNDPKEEMQGRVHKAERNRYYGNDKPSETAHLVRGEMTSIGYDGEPLLRNVHRVGDWIDHRHLLIPGAERHPLARDESDEDYEHPHKTAALDVKDYDGTTGDRSHITRSERGMIPTSAVAGMRGATGEVPGEHRNRQGQRWEDFKQDISSNGIKTPLFITVDHGEEPELSEGSHRRDAAVELGLSHVPAEIRYYGHAEQQGTVLDRAGRKTAASQFPRMPVHEMLRLPSVDGGTVADVLAQKGERLRRATELTDDGRLRSYDLQEDMAANGQKTPVLIQMRKGKQTLMDGHHRVWNALQLGHDSLTYTNRKTAAATKTKAQVNYRPADGSRRCGNCVMFRLHPPDFEAGACTLVKGIIDESDICDRWAPEGKTAAVMKLPPGYAMEVQQEEETHWGHPALHLNVSHEGKPVAGLGVFQRPDPETGSLVGHPNVWVHPGHQRKGLGTAMYAEVHRRWPGVPVKHSPHSSDDARELNQALKERFGPDLHYGCKTAARAPGDPIFHGTRHEFRPGDLISPGHPSNWPGVSKDRKGTHTYATEDLDEATHFAEQARKPGAGHVYQVEPTGRLLRDRELDDTDLVKSYQSRHPLRVVTEVPREMLPKHYNLDPIPQHAWDSDDSLRGRYGDWKSHQAVIRPGSLPDPQQSAFDVEDMREHRRQMLDVAKNPDPGTRVWRGELRPRGEHPSEATSVGMHWSVNPDSIIGRADQHEHVKSMGLRPVVWQGVVENHKEQAFGRGHPMWYGRHESFGHEAEVRFKPGARVKLEGAYVHDPGGGGENNYLVPQIPERTSPNWKWHPLDHHVTIAHRPGNIGTSDYSDLGIPKEGAVQNPPCYHCHEPLNDEDVADQVSAHEECEHMHSCPVHGEHDDPVLAEQHRDTHTDWGDHLPFEHGIHRGLVKQLPHDVHNVVHDSARPPGERASALRSYLHREGFHGGTQEGETHGADHEGHLGVHWTPNERAARHWGSDDMYEGPAGGGPKPSVTHVVLHARSPHEHEIETDPGKLEERHMYGFDHPRSEHEVPLKYGAPVRLTGISWKQGGTEDWHWHDFAGHSEHMAAVRDKPDSEYGGLMVAIVPPAGIVEHLTQDGGEDPDDLHVTLLYIGKGDDLAPGQAARLPELVSQWAKTCSPMKARTSGAGTFVSDERQHVLWASVDIPGIERAHVSLVDFLRGHGIKINEDYGYTPHITLKYEKWHVRFLPKIQPMSWDVSEIWFCQGGHWESFPLGRVPVPV